MPRHSARRLVLLEQAGLVDHEDRIVIRQMLEDIIADDMAQASAFQSLRPRIACCRQGPVSQRPVFRALTFVDGCGIGRHQGVEFGEAISDQASVKGCS
jgi:hypothetical protein